MSEHRRRCKFVSFDDVKVARSNAALSHHVGPFADIRSTPSNVCRLESEIDVSVSSNFNPKIFSVSEKKSRNSIATHPLLGPTAYPS